MDIKDFLPKYPNISNTAYDVLNPYDDNFYEAIYHKKEFYDNRLDKVEMFPKEKGMLMKYQKTIVRYMSSHTPYDRLLLVHFMGSGKCVLPGTKIYANNNIYNIEDLWNEHRSQIIVHDDEGEWSLPSTEFTVDSYDEKSGNMVQAPIKQFYRQYVKEPVRKVTLQGGHSITMTKKHKILTEKGWTNDFSSCKYVALPKKLVRQGITIDTDELYFAKISSIEEFDYEGWVYDLEVDEHHNYVANGIITHNTCSAIGAIEQIRSENSTFKSALILAKGDTMLDNFRIEIVEKCTAGQYIPANYNKLTRLEKIHRTKKNTKFYQMETFIVFGKQLRSMTDNDIVNTYSDRIVVIDEVHNLRPQSDDKNEREYEKETYNQIHRFLHLIRNCKILLLSGTPMKDGPEEIASVANLLLPNNDQLPMGDEFLEKYMEEKGGMYTMLPEKGEELKRKLKGMISFLREAESSIPKNFIGVEGYGTLKHLVVDPKEMSDFQSEHYRSAHNKDQGVGNRGKAYRINSREASLFVYPDGTYGSIGFAKYIRENKMKATMKDEETTTYSMKPELKNELLGETHEETLENIGRHSATYENVIRNILNTNGNCFVFSSIVQGSGAILFSLLLELFGYGKAKGTEKDKGLRYAVLSNKTISRSQFRIINEAYNDPKNMHGEYIKVIIGSRAVSEGFSFKNVIFESINTPHWNYSETVQALARGIRLGSHNDLMKAGQEPVVNILQPVAIPNNDTESIDLRLYEISEDKDISIHSVLRLLMEIAFDCALNYMRNNVEGKDGSRECNYTTCNYSCDDVNMQAVREGLTDKELDYSTYQLYYANPTIPLIKKKIENLFRENIRIDFNSIVKNLSGQFTDEEIRNAIYVIQEESESDEFDYRDFLRIYSRSPVKQIMNKIEELFRQFFRLTLGTILEQFLEYTNFEVITALQNIINESLVITDKYGLPSYLREENDVYFLVNSLSIQPDFFTEYYTSHPHVLTGRNFENIINRVYSMSLPRLVDQICKTKNELDFIKLIKSLPINVQEVFIEASLISQSKQLKYNTNIREWVLKYFNNYIKNIDGMYVSTLLKEGEEVLRCLPSDGEHDIDDWKDCEERYNDLIKTHAVQREQKLRQENPYGLMGKYNPEQKTFCIVDFGEEKETQTRISAKREKGAEDKRLLRSGKNCKSWHLKDLIKIVVCRLKIAPPEDFRRHDTRRIMVTRIEDDKNMNDLYTPEEFEELTDEDLRRVLYWGTSKKEKGKRGNDTICSALKNWFEEHGLLEIDTNCGVQGKKKIGIVEKSEKGKGEKSFRIEVYTPSKDSERFGAYTKEIAKLMGECFDMQRYRAPLDNNLWIMIFSRKKLAGFITVDSENMLHNVCVAKNYRRQGLPIQAMKHAINYACKTKGKKPILVIDNRNKDAKKLIRMYTTFGFKIDRADDKNTYMSYECSPSS